MSTAQLTEARPDAGLTLAKALLNAARSLGLRNSDLARVIGTSEASISRLARGRSLDPESKEGELSLLLLRLFRSLDAITGGNEVQAQAWMHGRNHHLGGVPAEHMHTVEGLVDVVRYLDAMRGRV